MTLETLDDTRERITTGMTPGRTARLIAYRLNPDFYYLLDKPDQRRIVEKIKQTGSLEKFRQAELRTPLPHNVDYAFW